MKLLHIMGIAAVSLSACMAPTDAEMITVNYNSTDKTFEGIAGASWTPQDIKLLEATCPIDLKLDQLKFEKQPDGTAIISGNCI